MALGQDSVIGGYRIVRLIGRGGMGAVYLADDLRLGRKVALKVLAPETAEIPAVRERFVRESQLAASLDHPHILPIYEAGQADGQLFIAMRYVPGPDLEGVIARDGPLPLERTVALVDQVSSALDVAHAAGLIHRDVKPGNILVAPGSAPGPDHAYLTDFGLTKHAEYSGGLTRSGQLMGSVGYVAPELIENRPIDARVDVYSLGCVLYECLAGTQPYPRDTEMATLYAHVQAPPPSLAGARPELPAAIDAVIAKAMAKTPEARYDSAGGLARALTEGATPDAASRHLTRGFLFADLRGYTAYVEAHGDEAGAALLDTYRRLVRDVVRRFGGAEIKTEGDSFYVVFPSASEAVRCGLALTAAAAIATTKVPERPIAVGVGIHAGETAETAEGYVGSAVNLAARICAQAAAGEVLVSDTVRGLTRTSSEVSFTARGRKHLKGIAEPIAVYAATSAAPDMNAGVAPPRRPTTTRLAGFSERRRPIVIAGAGAVVAIAVAALLVAGAFASGFRPSPSPSEVGLSTEGSAGTSRGIGSPGPSLGPVDQVVWSAEFVTENQDPSTICVPGGNGQASEARLYEMSPLGSAPIRLVRPTGDFWEREPDWTPEGNKVVFASLGDSNVPGNLIEWISAVGGRPSVISFAGDKNFGSVVEQPRWSPDGNAIAFSGTGLSGVGGLYTMKADGSDLVSVLGSTSNLSNPVDQAHDPITVDGRLPEGRLVATGPSPGAVQPTPVPANAGAVVGLAWLPSGKLSWVFNDGAGDGHVWVGNANGGNAAPLPIPSTFDPVAVAWPPSGSRMLIASLTSSATGEPAGTQIWSMNSDGTGSAQLTDEGDNIDPAWSPNGQEIVFASDRDGHYEIYSMNSDGGNQTRLTNTAADLANCFPTWGLSVAAAPTVTPTPAPGASQAPLAFHRGRLSAGTYVDSQLSPVVTFTVPIGWEAVHDFPDGMKIQPDGGTIAFRLDDGIVVAKAQTVLPSGCIDDSPPTQLLGPQPRDLITWLQGNKFLNVHGVFPVSMAGYSGLNTEITVKRLPGCGILPNSVWLFLVGQDQFRLQQGDDVQVIALDVAGTTITILAGGPDGATRDTFMTQAQGVMDSMQFGSP